MRPSPPTPTPTPSPASALAEFGESGNGHLLLLGSVTCVDQNCSIANFTTVTVKATPTGDMAASAATLTKTFDITPPYCAKGFFGAWNCQLAINDAINYVTYNLTIEATDTAGTKVSATFVVPVAARPWTVPETVHSLYNVPAEELTVEKMGQDGVVLWAGQYYDPTDLHAFLKDTGEPDATPLVGQPWKNATNNPKLAGDEGEMDIELITSTATGMQSTFWYASNNISTGFLDFCHEISDVPNPPLVWSCSWGTPEAGVPPDGTVFEDRVTVELQKMGVRGMTMVFASGDAGVTSAGRGGNCDAFQPSFPAASPYVLAVSGTVLDSKPSTAASKPSITTAPPHVRHGHGRRPHHLQRPRRPHQRPGDRGRVLHGRHRVDRRRRLLRQVPAPAVAGGRRG